MSLRWMASSSSERGSRLAMVKNITFGKKATVLDKKNGYFNII